MNELVTVQLIFKKAQICRVLNFSTSWTTHILMIILLFLYVCIQVEGGNL